MEKQNAHIYEQKTTFENRKWQNQYHYHVIGSAWPRITEIELAGVWSPYHTSQRQDTHSYCDTLTRREWWRAKLTTRFGQTYQGLASSGKILQLQRRIRSWPSDHWSFNGLYLTLNGRNRYAPVRPWLAELMLCANWSDRHIWPQL